MTRLRENKKETDIRTKVMEVMMVNFTLSTLDQSNMGQNVTNSVRINFRQRNILLTQTLRPNAKIVCSLDRSVLFTRVCANTQFSKLLGFLIFTFLVG